MTARNRDPRWRLVTVLGFSTVLSLSGDLTLYAILPVNAGGLLLTLGQIGILLSANRFVRLISNPLTGFLLDRGRRRPIYLSGLLLGTLSTLMYALTRQFWVLLIGRLLWGLAWSLINVGGNTMIVDSTQPSDRGRYLGILTLMLSLGLALNPLIGGFLADAAGFQPTMLICALLTGAGFFLSLLLLPETHPRTADTRPLEASLDAPSEPNFRLEHWSSSLKNFQLPSLQREIWLAILLTFVTFFAGNGLIMATVGRFLTIEFGQSIAFGEALIGMTALTGIVLGARALLIALAAPLSGAFSDRRKSRWPVVLFSLALGTLGMFALGGLPPLPALLVGITLVSLCEGALLTVLPAIVGDGAPEALRGRAMGLTFMAGDLGAALAPLLVYSLLALIPLRTVYLATGGAFSLCLVLMMIGISGFKISDINHK